MRQLPPKIKRAASAAEEGPTYPLGIIKSFGINRSVTVQIHLRYREFFPPRENFSTISTLIKSDTS